MIGGKSLPAGKYTLWTIPESDVWTIIFNNKQYSWGVDFKTRPSREPEADVLQVKVPVQKVSPIVDQFTISFQNPPESALVLVWDDVKIVVPFTE